MTTAELIEEHIRRSAASWYPALDRRGLTVERLSGRQRRRSSLMRFRVGDGHSQFRLLAKIATPPEEVAGPPERPRLGEPDDAVRKLAFEHGALEAMWRRLEGSDDDRIAAVRPLDLLEEHGILLIEEVPSRTLRDLLVDAAQPWGGRTRELLPALFEAVGAWMGVFHSLDLPVEGTLRVTVTGYTDALSAYASWLAERGAPSGLLHDAVEVASHSLADSGADQRTGPVHGDCAPRNVLVRRDGRVLLVDPLARWRAPVGDDLAYLIASLRVNQVRVLTGGAFPPRSVLRPLEDALLRGHPFGRDVPLRASMVLVILDRWAAGLARPFQTGAVRDLVDALERRRLTAELQELVRGQRSTG